MHVQHKRCPNWNDLHLSRRRQDSSLHLDFTSKLPHCFFMAAACPSRNVISPISTDNFDLLLVRWPIVSLQPAIHSIPNPEVWSWFWLSPTCARIHERSRIGLAFAPDERALRARRRWPIKPEDICAPYLVGLGNRNAGPSSYQWIF